VALDKGDGFVKGKKLPTGDLNTACWSREVEDRYSLSSRVDQIRGRL
jgi:hypothetical protein